MGGELLSHHVDSKVHTDMEGMRSMSGYNRNMKKNIDTEEGHQDGGDMSMS